MQDKKKYLKLTLILVPLIVLVLIWQFTPLNEYLNPQALVGLFREYFGARVSPYSATLVFSLAGFLMVPVNALLLATALLFNFWEGVAISLVGVLAASTMGYGLGRVIATDTLKKLFGKKFEKAVDNIGKESIMAVASLRIIPVAPFGVINVVFGNLRIPFIPYLFGSLMGMLPGIILINYFGRAVTRILEDPSVVTLMIGVAAIALIITLVIISKRLKNADQKPDAKPSSQKARA